MNDFIKNELEQLAEILDVCVDEKDIELLHKIDALIENYCEHKWVTDPRIHFMSNPPKIKLWCPKCESSQYIRIIDDTKDVAR